MTSSFSGSRTASPGIARVRGCSSATTAIGRRTSICTWPVEQPQITLLDLNENSLSVAARRLAQTRVGL
jgi:hypothetical protein